jgi:RNA polymerase sigma-70 factor, ECF subfamily
MTLDSSAAKLAPSRGVSMSQAQLITQLAAVPARKGFAIAQDLLRNRAEAEEAVQEALVRACESISDLRDPAALQAWFLRIVTNMCLRTLRRRRLRHALFGWARPDLDQDKPQARAEVRGDQSVLAGNMHAVSAMAASDLMLMAHHDRNALLEKVALLPAKQRAAIILRYGHDMPVADVAAALDVSLATAKTHLVRALEKLRELLEEST